MTFQDLQTSLRIDISTKGKIGMYKAGIDIDYLRTVQDTDYSFSINYFSSVASQISMETGYGPASALTADGSRAYKDGTNPLFGLICGDRFIDSYKAGALLMFAMKLEFHNHVEKDSFSVRFGISFGSFLSISTQIQKVAT
jgi:hypothetical protein